MVTNIIQIGNSKGIILPSEILKQLRLSLKSTVSVSLDGNNIVIKAQPRQGWAEAAKRAHENGDDQEPRFKVCFSKCSCHSFRFEYVPYNSSHCSDNLHDKELSLPGSVFCSRA